ncbi:membrane protein insertase YidC [Rhodohalobacter halophilus]|uniref:membrane protein insertase YidC n=1 Tax=Rhodohalobacter halophilus TaxID=1812810 RepID=UPI00083FBA89|nr:membrane protein insertase YidC [Rhodohalobacter halophilus]
MDKNTVTGLLLIFVLTIAWAWFTMPSQEELERQRQEQLRQDSIAAAQVDQEQAEPQDPIVEQDQSDRPEPVESTPARSQAMGVFGESTISDTTLTTIRTPLYEIQLTNLGAGPSKYTLLGHNTWDQKLVQMIGDTTRSAYSLEFLSSQNYNIETDQLLFEPLFDEHDIQLDAEENVTLSYRLQVGENSSIQFHYTFYSDQYSYDLQVELNNMESYISGTNVELGWKSPLNFTERDLIKDAQSTMAYTYAGGVLEDFQLDAAGRNEQRINGNIDWVSSRTRFFGQYIKPVTGANASTMIGELSGPPDEVGTLHHYQVFVQSSFVNNPVLEYEMYSGPLRYYDLRDYDEHAYDVIEIGYALFRWFADPLVRYAIIPFFAFGSMFISNYGILIILFGVIVKLALFPLTQKSFKSMAAMRELQPQLKEIQEKYKDDPQKQQKETIALYKKAKVNPIGGCLPMLLQFPILITLFFFFQNSMIIRQESFLWATDLSAPDYILDLPFTIPLLGDQLAGFVLLMSAAMFLQTKVTGGMSSGAAPSGGPNMKVFMYIMPVMLLFIFNNFAAGLSLYYLVYNVLSIAQQFVINKQTKSGDNEVAEVTPNNAKKKGKGKKK